MLPDPADATVAQTPAPSITQRNGRVSWDPALSTEKPPEPDLPEERRTVTRSNSGLLSDPIPEPLLRTIEVREVEILRLSQIDVLKQTFSAQVFITLIFPDGALDEALCKEGVHFNHFRPSAAWYATQIDFNNAFHYEAIGSPMITADGNDLAAKMRFDGVFLEPMLLRDFPFDVQDLTISIAINCRTTGKTPVKLTVNQSIKREMSLSCFWQHQEWGLASELVLHPYLAGTTGRLFPSCNISVVVGRRPLFYIVNVLLPTALFPPTAMLQFCIGFTEPPAWTLNDDSVSQRAAITLTLLLTAAAYKLSVASLMPPISYLTLTDKFSLSSWCAPARTVMRLRVANALALTRVGIALAGRSSYLSPSRAVSSPPRPMRPIWGRCLRVRLILSSVQVTKAQRLGGTACLRLLALTRVAALCGSTSRFVSLCDAVFFVLYLLNLSMLIARALRAVRRRRPKGGWCDEAEVERLLDDYDSDTNDAASLVEEAGPPSGASDASVAHEVDGMVDEADAEVPLERAITHRNKQPTRPRARKLERGATTKIEQTHKITGKRDADAERAGHESLPQATKLPPPMAMGPSQSVEA